MVTVCPHCGGKTKVGEPGLYRCPHCQTVFRSETPDQGPEPVGKTPSAIDTTPVCERCGINPSAEICAECGLFVCLSCAARDAAGAFRCRAHGAPTPSEEPPLLQTFWGLLTHPVQAFSRLNPDNSHLGRALGFAVVLGSIAVAVSAVYDLIFPPELANPAFALLAKELPILQQPEASSAVTLMTIILAPLTVLFSVFFSAAFQHLAFLIVGAGKRGFSVTLKIISYTFAASVFTILPLVGPFIFWVFSLVLTVIGCSRLHGVPYGRAIGGILVLMAFFAVLAMAVVLMLVAAGGLGVDGGAMLPTGGELI